MAKSTTSTPATTPAAKSGRKKLTPAEKEARKAALKAEPKSTRFMRLALPRVTKAIKAISTIGNLSGGQYESTPEQREKILAALNEAVNIVSVRLSKETAKTSTFTL